jgi:hypothetical protein
MVSNPAPLSAAASAQPSFPLPNRPSQSGVRGPESLQVPPSSVDRPDLLPRFLLLGERDDASFQSTNLGFTVDYIWPALTEGPVVRLLSRGDKIQVQELWDGELIFDSFGHGETVAAGLAYHFDATLAWRDAQRVSPDHMVAPARLDPREPFFHRWCRDRLGIRWHLPQPGHRLCVDLPAGILRALVVPCEPSEGGELARLFASWSRRSDRAVYGDAGDHDGHLSHRTAAVVCQALTVESSGPTSKTTETVECRLFVGAWRSVIELAQFLHTEGWDLAGGRLHAFICLPHMLVSACRNQQGRCGDQEGLEATYPPLLPPQVGLGTTGGQAPSVLGDATDRRGGGSAEGQEVLRSALDEAFPPGGQPILYALANPRAPVVSLSRPITLREPTVPVLCVLLPDEDAQQAVASLVYESTGKWLKLGHLVSTDVASFFVFPNVPDETHCYDPEGFFHLLPDAVRGIEEELCTAWVVEDFLLDGRHEGRPLTVHAAAGHRREGW